MPDADPIAAMRRQLADARTDFRARAEPLVQDAETQTAVDAFANAIGECSPDQAIDALSQWLAERRRAE